MWRQQRKKDLDFIIELFGNTTRIMGTILKINADGGMENYMMTAGNPMAEDTLIVGDEDNNVLLCFKKYGSLCYNNTAVEGVRAMPHFDYREECIVHKRKELTDVPERLINIIFQSNTVHNITNNFSKLKINSYPTQYLGKETCTLSAGLRAKALAPFQQGSGQRPTQKAHNLHNSNAEDFLSTFYVRGGMIPLKQVKNNPEWKKEYEVDLFTKRVHICKSCKNKAHKGCCSNYSSENRSMVTMIMGWAAQ